MRRSTDSHLIHANVDLDVICSEEPPYGSTRKPEELYEIIERFSLGRRRLELFGEDHNIRRGWLTLGKDLMSTNFDKKSYLQQFEHGHLLPASDRIEQLRPKSPVRGNDSRKRGPYSSK